MLSKSKSTEGTLLFVVNNYTTAMLHCSSDGSVADQRREERKSVRVLEEKRVCDNHSRVDHKTYQDCRMKRNKQRLFTNVSLVQNTYHLL